MDRVILVASALLLNAALAGPEALYAPLGLSRLTRFPASLIRNAERKLNRSHRSPEQRRLHGTILVAMVVAASLIIGWLGDTLFTHNARFLEILLLAALLPTRQTWNLATRIYRGLSSRNTVQARLALEGSVWRHYMLLDEYGIARAGIEILAVHFSEKILAPIFWYLLFGLPGLLVSKSVYLLVETLASTPADPGLGGFKNTAITTHFLLHYLPSRIAAILWPLAVALPPSGDALMVFKRIMAGNFIERFPQSLSLLAAASAVGVSLGGPTSAYADQEWLGTATAKATAAHVKRARYLFALAHLFLFILLGFFL